MGKNKGTSVSLGMNSRIFPGSPNAARMQSQLGVNVSHASTVTTEQVAESYKRRKAARIQLKNTTSFVQNEKEVMDLWLKIEEKTLELLKHGYDTDIKVEKLVQSGLKSSAAYQAAIQLEQLRGQMAVALTGKKFQLDSQKLGHQAKQEAQFLIYKYGLSIQQINASIAQKMVLAAQNQQRAIASKAQAQLEAAQHSAAMRGETYNPQQYALAGGNQQFLGLGGNGNYTPQSVAEPAKKSGGFLGALRNLIRF